MLPLWVNAGLIPINLLSLIPCVVTASRWDGSAICFLAVFGVLLNVASLAINSFIVLYRLATA